MNIEQAGDEEKEGHGRSREQKGKGTRRRDRAREPRISPRPLRTTSSTEFRSRFFFYIFLGPLFQVSNTHEYMNCMSFKSLNKFSQKHPPTRPTCMVMKKNINSEGLGLKAVGCCKIGMGCKIFSMSMSISSQRTKV
jgi:hypothetical protein